MRGGIVSGLICFLLSCFISVMLGYSIISQSRLLRVYSAKFRPSAKVFRAFPANIRSFSLDEKAHQAVQRSDNTTLTTSQKIEKLASYLNPPLDMKDSSLHLYETTNLQNNSLIAHLSKLFQQNKLVNEEYVINLLDMSTEFSSQYPNVITAELCQNATTGEKRGNLNICGDTHGQYDDFTEIFTDKVGGFPSETNRFIFNGDIADRGPKAVEIFATLLTMKIINPNAIHILRGNHETQDMAKYYGFKDEVMKKYSLPLLEKFYRFFSSLPIAAVVENCIFVVHGGLGPVSHNLTIEEINASDRSNFEDYDAVDELLWSDPHDNVETFATNDGRGGVGYVFGPRVTDHFLMKNNLSLLIRSHQVQDKGWSAKHNGQCLTVFSAPNYCGVRRNKGAILKLSKESESSKSPQMQTESESEQPKSKLQLGAILFDAK